jgi:hypothetical protein
MSIKPHENKLTIIIRTKESSKCMDLIENESNSIDYVYLSKQLYPDLQVDRFENCTNLKVIKKTVNAIRVGLKSETL